MNLGQLRISRRTATIAVAFVGLVSLAIGAHAALNKRSLDAAKAIGTEQTGSIDTGANRVALVIGNGHYPDASAPLAQPINDARGLLLMPGAALPSPFRRKESAWASKRSPARPFAP